MPENIFDRKEDKSPQDKKCKSDPKATKRPVQKKLKEPDVPHTDFLAEASVIGACILHPEIIPEIVDIVEPKDFYKQAYSMVFDAIRTISKRPDPIYDPVSIRDELMNNSSDSTRHFPDGDPVETLAHLMGLAPAPFTAAYDHARIIKDHAIRRKEISFAHNCLSELNSGIMTVPEFRKLFGEHFESSPESPSAEVQRVTVMKAEDIMGIETSRQYILEPWLFKRSLNMIFGWRGIGKSWVSTGIAISASTGKGFLGWKCPDDYQPLKTLFVDGEMTLDMLKSRIQNNYTACRGRANGNLQVITPDIQREHTIPNLATPIGQKAIENSIEKNGFELLILDNISTLFHGIDENDATQWELIQNWLVRLRSIGLTVIIIHHAGKGGTQRGTSRREDAMDTVIQLKSPFASDNIQDVQDGAHFEVSFNKIRASPGSYVVPFEAKLSKSHTGLCEWHTQNARESLTNYGRQMLVEGFSKKDVREKTGLPHHTITRLKKELEDGEPR